MSFFTDGEPQRAKEIVARYPRAKSAILPLAHLAQDQDGWLSPEAMEEIAELTGVHRRPTCTGRAPSTRCSSADPCGKLVVSVCTNVTCLVTGGPEVLEHLEARYATDPDVTVEEVECLAACGGAPAMQVNYEFHEKLTRRARREEIVEEYQVGHASAPRTISGARCVTPTAPSTETRIVTKRLHDRPDDSWTIDGALATRRVRDAARRCSPRATRPTCRSR